MKNLFDLIPFINLYPKPAQIVIVICIIVVIAILVFVPRRTPPPIDIFLEHKQSPKAILDIKISQNKVLTLKNSGNTSLENIKVFATTYLLDEQSFRKKIIEVKEANKIGGPIHEESILEIGREVKVDLVKKPFLKFFENPGKEDNTSILTYFCLRITCDAPLIKEKLTYYKVTSSVKNFPSFVDNQEYTAYSGGTSHDFIFDIPEMIIKHQKKMYQDK